MELHSNNNEFPHPIKEVDKNTGACLMTYFTGEHTGFVRAGEKGYFLPYKYKDEATNIYNMEVRPDDVWVASYPRSGTTWTQELVWLLANDLDYETAAKTPLTERFPFLEFYLFVHDKMMKCFIEENSHSKEKLKLLDAVTAPGWKLLKDQQSRRFIKTHLPSCLLPPTLLQSRVVYVARDPRDVIVSFYHLNRLIRTQGYIGDFKTYWEFFRRDLHHWTPYFAHIKEAWKLRNNSNFLFIFYEDLIKLRHPRTIGHMTPRVLDLSSQLHRVASFLGKKYSEEQISRLCDHLHFKNFRNNPSVNFDVMKELGILIPDEQPFVRSGRSGGWRDYFDEEMTVQADKWIKENLKDTDIQFPSMSS